MGCKPVCTLNSRLGGGSVGLDYSLIQQLMMTSPSIPNNPAPHSSQPLLCAFLYCNKCHVIGCPTPEAKPQVPKHSK